MRVSSRPAVVLVAALLVLTLTPSGARAEGGSIEFGWSETEFPGTIPPLQPFVPFDVWIVAVDAAGIEAYEFTVDLAPAECWIVVEEMLVPESAIDFGADPTPNSRNYLVGTGAVCLDGSPQAMLRLRLLTLQQGCFDTGSLSFAPAVPSSFDPPNPGYLRCDTPGGLASFKVGPDLVFAELPDNPQPPVIASFNSDVNHTIAGGDVTLSWLVVDADQVTIEPGGFATTESEGFIQVQPQATTTYVLTATNADGTRTSEVTVEVLPFAIVSFTATPSVVDEVQDVQLQWEVIGSAFVSIDGIGPQFQSGTETVRPEVSTTYTLRAINEEITRTATTRVTVNQIGTGSLQLGWSGTQFPGPAPMLEPLVPFDLWVVALDAPGGVGAYEFSVNLEPEGCFSVVEETIFPPGSTDIGTNPNPSHRNFLVLTAGACREGDILPLAKLKLLTQSNDCLRQGTASLGPAIPTSFDGEPGHLQCGGGSRAFETGPDVVFDDFRTPQPPAILAFGADRDQLLAGESTELSWVVNAADLIQIEPGGFSTTQATGSLVVQPSETTTYTMTATNVDGPSTAEEEIEVLEFAIVRFTATPSTITELQDVTLEWEVTGNASVNLTQVEGNDDLGPQPQVGSLVVHPFSTTNYRLTATNGDITRERTTKVTFARTETGSIQVGWSGTEYPGLPPVLEPFLPFDLFVVAIDPPAGIEAYEYSLHLQPEGCWIVTEEEIFPEGSSNFGIDPSGSIQNYLVGTGGVCHQGVITPLLRLQLTTLAGSCFDLGTAHIEGAIPSSFSPPRAGYLPCNCPCDLRPFGLGPGLDFGDFTNPTSAVTVDLRALGRPEGIRLTWDLGQAQDIRRLQIHRRPLSVPAGFEQLVLDLEGEALDTSGEFVDGTALPGIAYWYRARTKLGETWVQSEATVATRGVDTPSVTQLLGNRPNPFNPRTDIRFALAQRSAVTLEIFDTVGRRVRRVELDERGAGEYEWTWHGRDDEGKLVSSGVYHVRLQAASGSDVRPLALVR